MKKIIKSIIILSLAFVHMINPFYAAIIADYDGSAFITKSDFEELKANFADQIVNYENSIDSKIDGAIAAYLAGVRLQTTSDEKMIYFSWSNIEFINYEILPEFKVPSYNWWVTAGWFSDGTFTSGSGASAYDKKAANVCGYKQFKRVWGDNETCIRPKATLLYGDESNVGKVAWDGCAVRWDESWAINKIAWGSAPNLAGVPYYRVNIYHPLSFLSTGYIKGTSIKNLISARLDFQDSSDNVTWNETATLNKSNTRERLSYTYEDGTWLFSVRLEELSDGTDTVHDHIFVENGSTQQYLSNSGFTNTMNSCIYQTLTDADYGGVSGVETKVTGSRLIYRDKYNYDSSYIGDIIWDYENSYMPLVGLLETHYYAGDIYQEKYSVDSSNNVLNRTINWNSAIVKNVPPLTLNNGLEVCISEPEKEYEWGIEFDQVVLTDGLATMTNENEVDVYLSTVPFGDGITTSEPLKVIVEGKEKDYFTTTNQKGTFKWTVDDTKVVYMKCLPHYNATNTGLENYNIRLKDSAKYITVIS